MTEHKSSSDEVFAMLGIDSDAMKSIKQELNALHTSDAVQRLKIICDIYSKWISFEKERNAEKKVNINFYDILNEDLGPNYNLNRVLTDFKIITQNNDLMIKYEENENANLCQLKNCFILRRSHRDKISDYKQAENVNKLYFVDNNNERMRSMAVQDMMDNIHCFMDHTLRISPIRIEKERDKMAELNKKRTVDDSYDINMDVICQIIDRKQRNCPRLNDINRFKSGQNKFVSTSTSSHIQTQRKRKREKEEKEKDLAIYQSVVYNNNALLLKQEKEKEKETEKGDICFMDALLTEIEEIISDEPELKIDTKLLNKLDTFLNDEQFDSEAVNQDVNEENNSNIFRKLTTESDASGGSGKSVYLICTKFVKQCNNISDIYSNGYRFWYWPFYESNMNEENVVFKGKKGAFCTESNTGYLLSDWYIKCIFSNLKEECLNNSVAAFDLYQFDLTLNKATIKLQQWQTDENARKLLCNYGFSDQQWDNIYGIADNEAINLDHIICLLLYCNFSHQSYEFSRTFRKVHALESDRSLKKRHQQMAIWGKTLRELIECFGLAMSQTPDISVFYHGINSEMIFNSTNIKLNGPVSTTLDFMIAANTFAADGIVIDIRCSDTSTYFWNCNWWSDFSQEQERLFIGGLIKFEFLTIRNIPNKKNFQNFVIPMVMFNSMIRGNPATNKKARNVDLKYLKFLIDEEIANKFILSLPSQIDAYILRLFHHFAINVGEVVINLDWMDIEFWGKTQFGFKKFRCLFFRDIKDNNTLNILYFLKFLKKLKSFTIFHQDRGYKKTILINAIFLQEILEIIKYIDNDKYLRKSFEKIVIVNPKLEKSYRISTIIKQYNAAFVDCGWELIQITYKHPQLSRQCEETLCIKKTV